MLFVLASAAGLTPAPHVARAQDRRADARYIDATVVYMSGRVAGRTRPFRLIINDYTSDADLMRLNSALQRGEDELLSELSRMDAGRIQLGTGVGVPANAVFRTRQPDGTDKITVLYQRDVRFFELRAGTRSENYRFGYAEIFLNRNGRGEGTLIPAARVRLRDGNTWEVEDFGAFPARLIGVRLRGGSGRAR
ncbi:MAG TPA: hypothetical protein VGV38_22475 [Pyrinomonadaceae bacterium]|nr:hypothetical protein [Pyrinomonadaceae bacterium]